MDGAQPKSAALGLGLEEWVALQEGLLELERDAELLEAYGSLTKGSVSELESQGIALSRLTVLEVTTGLFGRTLVTLGDAFGRPLPAHRFTSGDIVGVRLPGSARAGPGAAAAGAPASSTSVRAMYDATGVATAATDRTVCIALDDSSSKSSSSGSAAAPEGAGSWDPSLGDRVRVDRLADDVTFKRLGAVLRDLREFRHGAASKLLRVLFSADEQPQFGDAHRRAPLAAEAALRDNTPGSAAAANALYAAEAAGGGWKPFNRGLNVGQLGAVSACLNAVQLAMIHGPPGTGKTTTVVEYIRQEAARGRRVLACAPSNVAVDNLVERLAGSTGSGGAHKQQQGGHPRPALRVVRLGHPARVSAAAGGFSLDAHVRAHSGSAIVGDVRVELAGVQRDLRATRDKGVRRALRAEERRLRGEVRMREEAVVGNVLRTADVVLCTLTGAATKVLRKALATGDAPHLPEGGGPPHSASSSTSSSFRWFDVVVIDEVAQAVEAAAYIPALLGPKLVVAGDHCQLPPTVYRMHATISDWASGALYGGALVPDASVARHTLRDLPHVAAALRGVIAAAPPHPATAGAAAAGEGGEGEGSGEGGVGSAPAVCVPLARLAAVHLAAAEATQQKKHGADPAAPSSPPTASSSSGGGAGGAPPKGPHARGAAGGGGGGHAAACAPTHRTDIDVVAALASQTAAVGLGCVSDGGHSSALGPTLDVDVASLTAPMLLIDTAGCDGCAEAVELGGDSKANVGEADVVVKHVLALSALGLRPADMAVVTPYNAQVALLRSLLGPSFPGLEVRSVDGFQGQEKEAIILSLVRSNVHREVGFLADHRRLNVAVTRARRHVALVCDSDTVSVDPFIRTLLEYAAQQGEVRSAAEYASPSGHSAAAVVDASRFEAAPRRAHPRDGAKAKQQPRAGTRDAAQPKPARNTVPTRLMAAARNTVPTDPQGKGRYAAVAAQIRQLIALCEPGRMMRPGSANEVASSTAPGEASSSTSSVTLPLPAATAVFPPAPGHPTLEFSPTLTSYERMLVHLAATSGGLRHGSVGEGLQRRAIVYAPDQPSTSPSQLPKENGPAESLQDFSELALPEESQWAALHMNDDEDDDDALECRVDAVIPSDAAKLSRSEDPHASVVPSEPSTSEMLAGTPSLPPPAVSEPAAEPQSPGRKPVVTSARLGTAAEASSAGGSANRATSLSLAAQLAAERRARATGGGAAVLAGAVGTSGRAPMTTDEGLPSLLGSSGAALKAVAAGGSVPMGTGRKLGSAGGATRDGNTFSSTGTEYGLPVSGTKALPATSSTRKNGKGKKGAASGPDTCDDDDDDDEMALLDALVAASKKCAAKGCKTSTTTVGCTCKHCKLRFCYEHGLPEVHGCGASARSDARSEWTAGGRGMAAATGQALPSQSSLKDWQRGAVADKLHKRLEEASAMRLSGDAKKQSPAARK